MSAHTKKTAHFKWVRSIGRYWILFIDPVEGVLFLAAFIITFALHFLGFGDWIVGLGLSLIVLSFILMLFGYWAFYGLIRCPRCGHNPIRYKNGRNLPHATAEKKLAELEVCPACGALDSDDSKA